MEDSHDQLPHALGSLKSACDGFQMDSSALEVTIGGRAAQRTPLQILVDIEGPDSTFQQDVSDYFCYAQLAQQVRCCCHHDSCHAPHTR